MGSGTSDLTENIKAQAREVYRYTDEPSIYKFVGIHGSGELIRLIHHAVISKDFTEIDHQIKTEIVRYLLNNGNGKYVIS